MDDGLGGHTTQEVSTPSTRAVDGLRLRIGVEPAPQTTAHINFYESQAQVVSRLTIPARCPRQAEAVLS